MGVVKGLRWLGTRTERYDELVAFYRRAFGVEPDLEEGDFAVFRLPDGATVEVFGPSDTEHHHFDTGPVAGFTVDDIAAGRVELEAAGARFLGPTGRTDGWAWAHFLAPDGNVYELSQPAD